MMVLSIQYDFIIIITIITIIIITTNDTWAIGPLGQAGVNTSVT